MTEPADRFWPRYASSRDERDAGSPQFRKVANPKAFRYNRSYVADIDWGTLAGDVGAETDDDAREWLARQPDPVRKLVQQKYGLHKTEKYGLMPHPVVGREDLFDQDRRTDRGGDPSLFELLRGEIADPVLNMLNIGDEEARNRPDPFHGGKVRSPGFRVADKLNRDLGEIMGNKAGTLTGVLSTVAKDYERNVAKPFRRHLPGEYVPLYAEGLGIWSKEEGAAYKDRVVNRPNLAESVGYDPLNIFEVGALAKLVRGAVTARRFGSGKAVSLEDSLGLLKVHDGQGGRRSLLETEFDPGRRKAIAGIGAGAIGLKAVLSGGPESAQVIKGAAELGDQKARLLLEEMVKQSRMLKADELMGSLQELLGGSKGPHVEWAPTIHPGTAAVEGAMPNTMSYANMDEFLKSQREGSDLFGLTPQELISLKNDQRYGDFAKKIDSGEVNYKEFDQRRGKVLDDWDEASVDLEMAEMLSSRQPEYDDLRFDAATVYREAEEFVEEFGMNKSLVDDVINGGYDELLEFASDDVDAFIGTMAQKGKAQYSPEVAAALQHKFSLQTLTGRRARDSMLDHLNGYEKSWMAHPQYHHRYLDTGKELSAKHFAEQRRLVRENGVLAADEHVIYGWIERRGGETEGIFGGPLRPPPGSQAVDLLGGTQKRRVSLKESLSKPSGNVAPPEPGAFDAVMPPAVKLYRKFKQK
jgi:hypothetical protein